LRGLLMRVVAAANGLQRLVEGELHVLSVLDN